MYFSIFHVFTLGSFLFLSLATKRGKFVKLYTQVFFPDQFVDFNQSFVITHISLPSIYSQMRVSAVDEFLMLSVHFRPFSIVLA